MAVSEMSYHDRMAREAELRARVLYAGRADPGRSPKVLVEPSKRREVEAFAAKLREVQPAAPDPERAEYARMDAAAMVYRLAGDNQGVLESLQVAILNQDMGAFVEILESADIGSRADRANLRHFIAKQDRSAIAASIRILARGAEEFPSRYEEEMGLSELDIGLERVNPSDPMVGHQRRSRVSMYLRGNDFNNPAPFRRPAGSSVQPETLAAIELADEVEDWERDMQYNAEVLLAANACMYMREEAAQIGHFDGRIDGAGPHPGWGRWHTVDDAARVDYATFNAGR